MLPINYVAVLVAAIASFVIGFLLHGPVLGKMWMELANIHPTGDEKFMDMMPQIIKNILADILFAYGLSAVYVLSSTSTLISTQGAVRGMMVAFLVWLGFIVASSSMEVIWMGRSYKLWWFELFASLLSCLAMGTIIAVL